MIKRKKINLKSNKKKEDGCRLLVTSLRFQGKEFFEKSTLHGVRYIAEKDRPFSERFMWFCLTSIGLIVTLIIIVSLWEKFQTNPTITGLDTDFHDWEVPFPTITLCPQDITNTSLVHSYIEKNFAGGNISSLDTSDSDMYFDFVRTISTLNVKNLKNMMKFSGKPVPTSGYRDVIYKVASRCPDVVFDCEWKGAAYNCCDGFTTVLTEVGFCYIFNSPHYRANSDSLRLSNKAEFKPYLIYETDSKWSFSLKMENVSENQVAVYIHSAEEIPSQDMAVQHMWNGNINKISFSVKHTYTTDDVKQLSIKQRHCIFPTEVKLLTATNYTYSVCMVECRMKLAQTLCSCVPFFYPELGQFPHCDLQGLLCLAKSERSLSHDSECSCELGCMNSVYEVEKLSEVIENNFDSSLEIGFVSWPMVRFKREVLFGWVDLLVSFGGIAGLFLGFSLLSGVETVYYFTLRACCMVYQDREELSRLKHDYETKPRPDINLSLRPSFWQPSRVKPHVKADMPFIN